MGDITSREAGRLGGQRLVERRGKEWMAEIGTRGGNKVKERLATDPEYYQRIGRMGGVKRKGGDGGRTTETEG